MMLPRIETAHSAGLSEPIAMPTGASTRASSSAAIPRASRRANICFRFVRPAAQAVEPARAEAREVEPDRSAGAVGDALPTKCLHLLLETRTADGPEARPVGEDDHLGAELAGDAALDRRDRAQREWRSRRDELRCLAHHPQRQFHACSTGAGRDQPPPWRALALERKVSRQRA